MASPATPGGRGAGTSKTRSAPGLSRVLARMGRPPAVNRPSAIRRWTWLRLRPERSVTKRSARSGGRPTGTAKVMRGTSRAALAHECRDQQQQDRRRDGGVRDVEGVPAQVPDAHVHEVQDVAEAESVDEVA